MNHQALITFVTSLTLWARCSARENGTSNKGPPQPQPPSVHSECENLSNYGFHKILLTFHLLSSSHFPQTPPLATVLHSQSPGPAPEENSVQWITKQAYSNSPAFLLSCACADVDSTRSPQVKTASQPPPLSYPGRGPGSRETHGAGSWAHKAQINRDGHYLRSLHLITLQISGLHTPGSSFLQHSRQSLIRSNQLPFQTTGRKSLQCLKACMKLSHGS